MFVCRFTHDAAALGSGCLVAPAMLLAATVAVGASDEPTADADRTSRDFAPGVRIYWKARAVEVDAKIALRSGPLELLACALQTREHESVLVVRARPKHIYQAMGLIGLEPGHPVRYDAEAERYVPATGAPLTLAVRFGRGENARFVDASDLMRSVDGDPIPQNAFTWVFAGSRTFKTGRFGADADGTVACVVDFDTALITVDALHSADNNELWLEANTPEIPEVGTPCKLLIMSKRSAKIRVTVSGRGKLSIDGRQVKPVDVAKLWREYAHTGPSRPVVVLVSDGALPGQLVNLSRTLAGAGVPSRIEE